MLWKHPDVQTQVLAGSKVHNYSGPNYSYSIDCSRVKQSRVTHYSYGAELFAAEDADDRGS